MKDMAITHRNEKGQQVGLYNQHVHDKLVWAVKDKQIVNFKQACHLTGVNYNTFTAWIADYKKHQDASMYAPLFIELFQAKAESLSKHLDLISTAAHDPKMWTAAAWWIERNFPEEYSDPKLQLSQGEQAPRVIVQIGTVENLNLQKILSDGTDKETIDAEILNPLRLSD